MEKRTAFILGALRGLGRAIADECLRRGMRTYEVSRHPDFDRETDDLEVEDLSLENFDDVGWMAERIIREQIPLDDFYWVAGTHLYGPAADVGINDAARLMAVNFTGGMRIALAALKRMQERGGRFIIVASTSGLQPRPNEAVYCASKYAQVGFTRSLMLETDPSRIKVCLFCPGGMDTGFLGNAPKPDNLLDTKKVATFILDTVSRATGHVDFGIPRGSL